MPSSTSAASHASMPSNSNWRKYVCLATFQNRLIAIEEILGEHPLFTCKLEFIELKKFAILTSHAERFPLDDNGARDSRRTAGRLGSPVDLQNRFLAITCNQRGPGSGNGRQTTDEVINLLSRLLPVDLAGLLENLRSGLQEGRIVLRHRCGMAVRRKDGLDGLQTGLGPEAHQTVIDIRHISGVREVERLLEDNPSRIDVMVEKERGDSGLRLTVDDGPEIMTLEILDGMLAVLPQVGA